MRVFDYCSVRFAHTAHVCRWRSKLNRAVVKEGRDWLRVNFADIGKIVFIEHVFGSRNR